MAAEDEVPTSQATTMRRLELLLALFLFFCAAGLAIFMPRLVASGGIEEAQTFIRLSPIFFPRLAFGLLALLCLGYSLIALRQLSAGGTESDPNDADRYLRAGLTIVVAVVYAYLVPWLGFIPSTMLMTAVVAIYLGLWNPFFLLPGVVVIPIAIRFVFERLLLISLPRSDFESIALMEDSLMKFLKGIFLGG